MPKAENSLNKLLYDLKRIEEHREKLTEEKIRKIYVNLMDELQSFLGDTYVDLADADGRLYIAQMRENARLARFLEEVTERVDLITPPLRTEMLHLVDETYTKCFIGMETAVKTASNTKEIAAILGEDSLVRPEVLKRAVDNNISKLTLPTVLEKNRQSIIYDIRQTLTIGLVNGDRYEDMVKKVQKTLAGEDGTGGYYGKACNIVRTESHRNIEAGFMDCAENISKGVEGSDYVYVAIWRTMKDERVRPQQRYKTKKGWKTKINKNGANHVKMEGVTVKAGDYFILEKPSPSAPEGVKTKCPGMSGYARHDCNERCILEYDVMTVAEFEKVKQK